VRLDGPRYRVPTQPRRSVRRLLTAGFALGLLAGCSQPAIIHQGAASPRPSALGARQRGPAVMSRSRPLMLRIPAIDVTSALIRLGLRPDGTMQVPPKGFPAGWFTGAPTPGERGPAIIVGHVDWAGRPGVFGRLHQLSPGSAIEVGRADGTVAHFRITAVRSFDKDAFPTDLVYGNLDRAALRLITCGGSFDRRRHSYRDNVIVFADMSALAPAN
jgi:hypothetical protein